MRAFVFGFCAAMVLMVASGLVYHYFSISAVEQSATAAVHVHEG